MSRIRCSQCGQEGHNRRNRNCPVNSGRRISNQFSTPLDIQSIAPEFQARINMTRIHLLAAMGDLEELTRIISTPSNTANYVIGVVREAAAFCTKINLALDNEWLEIPQILPEPIFAYFETQINAFNSFLELTIVTPIRLIVSFQNRKFGLTLVDPNEPAPAPVAIIKRTSAYLKELSFAQDLTIAEDAPDCDCPLCFDPIKANEIIVTNCNHAFCGTCVKGFTNAIKDKTKKPECHMCRATITGLKVGSHQIYTEISEHLLNL